MPKKTLYIILTIIACLFIAGGIFLLDYYLTFRKSNTISDKNKIILIPAGSTTQAMMDSLKNSAAFKNWKSFERASRREELSSKFVPGRYVIKPGSSNIQIIRDIRNGWETPVRLVLSGRIRDYERLSKVLSKNVQADSAQFMEVFKDTAFIISLGFNKQTFPAMFIPNTYEVFWTSPAKDIILRLKNEYDKFWNKERLAKADSIKLTPVQVSILASIVSEETNYVPEMPTIAGVYMNRLRKRIKLEACPTVLFVLKDPSITRLLNKHLKIDSPYNTYKYYGLPPGPIAIPPISTIDAVLNYERHEYIFFSTRPERDGRHNFAVSYEDHLSNAKKFRKVAFK